MSEADDRLPLGRVMIGNAFLLSSVYLAVGVAVELLRKHFASKWVMKASLMLDSLPMRVLDLLGLLAPIKDSYAAGELGGFWLRAIFALTAVGVIFAMAVVVGAVTWSARRAYEARASRSAE